MRLPTRRAQHMSVWASTHLHVMGVHSGAVGRIMGAHVTHLGASGHPGTLSWAHMYTSMPDRIRNTLALRYYHAHIMGAQ